ncbi:alginate lyase family protein [Slackia heliotrinireducens]|uniref:alginate lyase family protein n=1 Tax=Slackia heliotrinireducens TaxID=84110 RepID=UPI003314CD2E
MSWLSKALLYVNTIRNLRPEQVVARVERRLGLKTALKFGYVPSPDVSKAKLGNVAHMPKLDFDELFLARFDVDDIMGDRICLLHHVEDIDWSTCWHAGLYTPLWEYNLHYCEYLLPLAKAYLETRENAYVDKGKAIIGSWIDNCPRERGGVAWDSYTIAMRCVNWLAFCGEIGLDQTDPVFMTRVSESLLEQYVHLATHLETDLLANHYFEDLKAIGILGCYFGDDETLEILMPKLSAQIDEQILPDGMHFELSPMYHKIIFEDMMRLAGAFDAYGYRDACILDFRLQDMANCLYSLERNVDRTPLFNDSGDNVAKGRDALLGCARSHFGIKPSFQAVFPYAGYRVIERDTSFGLIKIIFDTGKLAPPYAMGHSHCDALSFECFIDGAPWIVNCGTYAYQSADRLAYKQTQAHSTVQVSDSEQHECWASFRVARYGDGLFTEHEEYACTAAFTTYNGRPVARKVEVTDNAVIVTDATINGSLTSYFIFNQTAINSDFASEDVRYAPEFGESDKAVRVIVKENAESLCTIIRYPLNGILPEITCHEC